MFDAIFNIPYTFQKLQKTLKSNNLIDRNKYIEQLSNK